MRLVKGQIRIFRQITPTIINDIMKDKDTAKLAKGTEAFLKMKKFSIAELIEAYEN